MNAKTRFRTFLSLACCAMLLVCLVGVPVSAAGYSTVTVVANQLPIRQGPGSDYPVMGTLSYGYVTNVNDTENGYGHIAEGWIDLDQVRVVSQTSGGAIIGVGYKGYVAANQLNVRTGPGTNYPVCGTLSNGAAVTILETNSGWGRINGGWISLNYLSAGAPTNTPVYNPPVNTPAVNDQVVNGTATVGSKVYITATQLSVREGPGTGYNRLGTYGQGQLVELREIKGNWGRTSRGWICLDYTTYAPTASGTTQAPADNKGLTVGTTIRVTAESLRVREGAGVNYAITGAVSNGYTAQLLEVSGSWGRIASGWISLDHVTRA